MSFVATLHLDRIAVIRMIVAGSAWGLTLSAGFFVMALLQCGVPCPDDVATVTAACMGTGILTIGVLAAVASPDFRKKNASLRATGPPVALTFSRSISLRLSGGERHVLLGFALALLVSRPSGARKLQHRGALAFTEIRYQDDLAIRKLQGVVMGRRPVKIDLPKPRDLVHRFPRRQEAERCIALDLLFECQFGSGQQANGNTRLGGISKAARDGIGKLCRYQLVTDLGGPGRNIMKTIVTH